MEIAKAMMVAAVCGVAACGCEKASEMGEAAVRKSRELGEAAALIASDAGKAVSRKAGQMVGVEASHFFRGLGEGIEAACAEFKSELEKNADD